MENNKADNIRSIENRVANSFKIGNVSIDNITVMAPLAGITNLPFRLMIKKQGCGLVCSEMISSNGLVYNSKKTIKMLDSVFEEKPLSVQLFGSNPLIMAYAAQIVESSGADIIDINFGCSVKKVLKTGSGSALMKDYAQAKSVIQAVRAAVKIPMTIKIRSGWDRSGKQALEISKLAQDCGVDAIAIHPRTASQGFKGHSDWSLIKLVKQSLSIPVIGNGDILNAHDAIAMLKETGCDAVMIGRAAIGSPEIFNHINTLFKGDDIVSFDIDLHFQNMLHYLEASVKYIGEEHACLIMRSRLGWFVKGFPSNSRFRESIKKISSYNQAKNIINEYKAFLSDTIYND